MLRLKHSLNFEKRDSKDLVHVAVREIKEETYRALRWAGYSWGQAQSAGRIATVSEIIWGNGITSTVSDVNRKLVRRRSSKLTQTHNAIVLNTRGVSTIMAAAFAVAISQSQPGTKVFVKGSHFGPDVAAAVWDTKYKSHNIITWGAGQSSGLEDLSVLENGDLVSHVRLNSMLSIPSKYNSLWFVICHPDSPSGTLVLGKQEQEDLIKKSLVDGLEVSQNNWIKLTSKSYKFLVAE